MLEELSIIICRLSHNMLRRLCKIFYVRANLSIENVYLIIMS